MLIASFVLFVSALPIHRSRVGDTEADIFHAVNSLPGLFDPLLQGVMQFGNFLFVPVASLFALVLRRFRLAIDITLAGTAAWLLAKLVKDVFLRGRPAELLSDVILRGAPGLGHGYVSGHTAVAAALAAVVTPYLPRRLRLVVWTAAVLVGIARVYVGAHLPLDVIGGGAMGWAIGSLVHFLLGPPDPPAEPKPRDRSES